MIRRRPPPFSPGTLAPGGVHNPLASAVWAGGTFLAPAAPAPAYPTAGYVNLMQDVLINADLWDKEPRILTANYAFEGIQGVVNGNLEPYAVAAGENFVENMYTSASL